MSTHAIHPPLDPRDLISERAARRAAAHPRLVLVPDPAPLEETPVSPAGPRILRRWSVAALRATARRPPVSA